MKRREFLRLGMSLPVVALAVRGLESVPAFADGKTITAKDILQEGQPATIANYCEKPDKQPNKFCADWKTKPGHCATCRFFNVDNSEATFKGGKYAHCQLLTDPKKAQYTSANGWCSTYLAKT